MPKPPKTPPSSDIVGADRDWRAGLTSKDSSQQPGAKLVEAGEGNAARPDEGNDEAGDRESTDTAGAR